MTFSVDQLSFCSMSPIASSSLQTILMSPRLLSVSPPSTPWVWKVPVYAPSFLSLSLTPALTESTIYALGLESVCVRPVCLSLNPLPSLTEPSIYALGLTLNSAAEGQASRGRADVPENEKSEGICRDAKSSWDGGQQNAGEYREIQVDGEALVAGPTQKAIGAAKGGAQYSPVDKPISFPGRHDCGRSAI